MSYSQAVLVLCCLPWTYHMKFKVVAVLFFSSSESRDQASNESRHPNICGQCICWSAYASTQSDLKATLISYQPMGPCYGITHSVVIESDYPDAEAEVDLDYPNYVGRSLFMQRTTYGKTNTRTTRSISGYLWTHLLLKCLKDFPKTFSNHQLWYEIVHGNWN